MMRQEQRELLALNEAIAVTEGEISAETSTLQRIADKIAEIADSAFGCATGDKRDCIAIAVRLANEQAEHEGEMGQLQDKLRRQSAERDGVERAIADHQDELRRVQSAMSATRCSEFPLF